MLCVFQNEEALHKLKGENVNPFNNLYPNYYQIHNLHL